MQRNGVLIAAFLSATALVSGCAYEPIFGFPADVGNVSAGRQAFIDHQCHRCHDVAGETLPPLAGADPPIFELGGEISAIRTYGDLMTSVINPNHVISEEYREQLRLRGIVPIESPMPMPHIDNMTVRQLIDIVAFLDSKYLQLAAYDSDR